MKFTQYLLFLFAVAICWEYCSAGYVTKTKQGTVSGKQMTSSSGKKFYGFSGIPYAEPPIKNLRFKSPVPKNKWHGTLEAKKDGNECIQLQDGDVRGSEDCLYLNVYTPELNPKSPLPVVVFIVGGAYLRGNASIVTAGPEFMLDKKMVLVTFNYRLGIFGFLSSGNSAAPGNYALKDQVLVLEWVQENIHNFGGDPKEVTLYGQGAGADSVGLLALSDRAKHLFKRYATHSGGAVNPHAYTSDTSYYDKAKEVAEKFGCSTSDSKSTIECLRGIDASKLVKVTDVFNEIERALSTEWRPTVEPSGKDAILTDTPANLIRKNKLKICPLIAGIVKEMGAAAALAFYRNQKLFEKLKNNHMYGIGSMLQLYEPLRGKNITELTKKIYYYYLTLTVPDGKNPDLYRYMLFVNDLFFLYPQQQFIEYLQKENKAPIYITSFNYRGALSYAIPLNEVLGDDIVSLGDDLFYIFPRTSKTIGPQYNIERTKNDYEIIGLLGDLIFTFVTDGKPSSPRLGHDGKWIPFSKNSFLRIGNEFDPSTVQYNISKESQWERLQFWIKNVPRYNFA
ncbi:juvenile hormone esterase-like [Xylocopa sonorina]|uniref:juvenile hormone esterase-like n=1 Tax=Xylocopa sonorina TaxID=1818115 RepID=UPI00403AC0E0